MKRLYTAALFACAAALAISVGATGAAAQSIDGSPHDLPANTNLTVTGTGEICIFCHSPHNNSTDTPLWNRAAPTGGAFTPYSSPSMVNNPGNPSGASLLCLSCHDGTVALETLTWSPGTITVNLVGTGTTATMANLNPSANLGTDLSNDHPISMNYGTTTAGFNANPTGVKLFGPAPGTVECASCHNPHDNDQVATNASKFLRSTNANSAMCLACHNR